MSRKRRNNDDDIDDADASPSTTTFAQLTHPNFEELARIYPSTFGQAYRQVQQHQKESGGNFASNITEEFTTATTKALLHAYFGLDLVQIPSLCPPIPNRYFLVQWIQQSLLPLTDKQEYFLPTSTSNQTKIGMDIGTGATAIYPLLFCAPKHPLLTEENNSNDIQEQWNWLASEIDKHSVAMAQQNVQANTPKLLPFHHQIQIISVPPTTAQEEEETTNNQQQQEEEDTTMQDASNTATTNTITARSGPLLRLWQTLPEETKRNMPRVHVVMTNPPFHDPTSTDTSRNSKRQGDQRLRANLTQQEATYPGGEVAFVTDILVDALILLLFHNNDNDNSSSTSTIFTNTWYACMLGKKTSSIHLYPMLTYLLGPARVRRTEFGPGNLTRWFLAWTFATPTMRSPLAAYLPNTTNNPQKKNNGTKLQFDVTITDNDNDNHNNDAVSAVVDRIVAYFREQPKYTLTVDTTTATDGSDQRSIVVTETVPAKMEWEDKRLPESVLEVLQKHQENNPSSLFLPEQGHFLLDVSVYAVARQNAARVELTAFVHSQYGKQAIEALCSNRFQGEICRTTRKWRRFLQRQQQEQQPMEES